MEVKPGYLCPPGYKQTEGGVIPQDWDVKSANQIGTPVRGGSPRPAGDPRYFNGSYIPWLTVAALTNIPESQLVVSETATCLTEEGSLHSRTLTAGTLIIANSGATLGVAKILGVKCCANDGIAALLNLSKHVSPRYLAHFINTKTSYLRDIVATGNGQPNLNTELIGNFKIPFPSTKAEQEAIAEALSDADALIESLEQLLAKKRDLKQGAMQELLTGKKRLPGFSGKWMVKRLGDVVEIQKGELITERNAVPGTIPVIAGGKQPAYFHNCANRSGKTITISGSGANAGYVTFYEAPIFASDCSSIGEGPNYSVEFIYFVLLLNQGAIYKAQTGGAQPHIHPNDLRPLLISVPEAKGRGEQAAIAAILSDMDAEIDALEEKLAKVCQLKQGMMQELLTGRIRLPLPEAMKEA
jgi:type I restriction enzyme S subunit